MMFDEKSEYMVGKSVRESLTTFKRSSESVNMCIAFVYVSGPMLFQLVENCRLNEPGKVCMAERKKCDWFIMRCLFESEM